jgi:putative transposase
MVTPGARREAVAHLRVGYRVSERRACRVLSQWRSVNRYRSLRGLDGPLRERLRAHAGTRRRWGHRRLHWLITREGIDVGKTRLLRIYREEALQVRKRRRRRSIAAPRVRMPAAAEPNAGWSMDFVHDAIAGSRRFRSLTIVDDFTKECLAIEVDTSLPGLRVARVLDRLLEERGKPRSITVDNGPEFAGMVLDEWAHQRGVTLQFIRPGKPTENAYIESFNGRFRDECLNDEFFISLQDADQTIQTWRHDYNHHRPHSALGGLTPAEFASRWKGADSAQPQEGLSSEVV